jgi:hypothetical protein
MMCKFFHHLHISTFIFFASYSHTLTDIHKSDIVCFPCDYFVNTWQKELMHVYTSNVHVDTFTLFCLQ